MGASPGLQCSWPLPLTGPNSPVGVMWMGLNKTGIGLHGTNNPETIGRAASHGCIRMANWDALKLQPTGLHGCHRED